MTGHAYEQTYTDDGIDDDDRCPGCGAAYAEHPRHCPADDDDRDPPWGTEPEDLPGADR